METFHYQKKITMETFRLARLYYFFLAIQGYIDQCNIECVIFTHEELNSTIQFTTKWLNVFDRILRIGIYRIIGFWHLLVQFY